MKCAILTFPGTNCQEDLLHTVVHVFGHQATYVRHDIANENALIPFDIIFLPGGSSYGDHPRPGAKAATAPIIPALHQANAAGKIIFGICNGFQILTQAKLLPGTLESNEQFICKTTKINVASNQTPFTHQYQPGEVVNYPIAHASGRYHCSPQELQALAAHQQILFTYQNNPNGSIGDIAGITNKKGNVLGMMPHPERAVEAVLGNTDGFKLFESIFTNSGGN